MGGDRDFDLLSSVCLYCLTAPRPQECINVSYMELRMGRPPSSSLMPKLAWVTAI